MRLPLRRAQRQRTNDDQEEHVYLTRAGLDRLEREIYDLERVQRPRVAEEVDRAKQLGDFSENAEYQDAKHRLARMNARIFTLHDRLHRVRVIEDHAASSTNLVQIGSVVTVRTNDHERTYHIVGPQESNPARGRISYVSPLGGALLKKAVGDTAHVKTEAGEFAYTIIAIQ